MLKTIIAIAISLPAAAQMQTGVEYKKDGVSVLAYPSCAPTSPANPDGTAPLVCNVGYALLLRTERPEVVAFSVTLTYQSSSGRYGVETKITDQWISPWVRVALIDFATGKGSWPVSVTVKELIGLEPIAIR